VISTFIGRVKTWVTSLFLVGLHAVLVVYTAGGDVLKTKKYCMSLITVGTMAFDAIETPFGKTDKIIGGSATYVAYAAANFVKPVQQVSIVGYDFPQEEMEELRKRGVQLDGVQIVPDKKSFFWSGRYHEDMNSRDTLVTDLNVLADFNPQIPESYQGSEFLMLGNLVPAIQLSVIRQMKKRPKLIVMDTMNFWMESALPDLEEVLKHVDVLLVNDAEARQLTGQFSLVKAAKSILQMGPKYLIIKKGEHGALLFDNNSVFFAPALPLEDVFDPTGAGDTFAGGFMGHIAKSGDISFENMKRGIIVGSAMASFCVEKFGPTRLKEISYHDIEMRIQQFKELVNFEIELGV
jgi:sugar/nucleoside kinase (ribokinase family)